MTTNSLRLRRAFRRRERDAETADKSIVDLGPLFGQVGYRLRLAQLAMFRDFLRTFAEVAIRPAQFGVLTVIEHNPGLKQADVSAALGIKRTNLVALLDSLEERGYARREAASDRRSYALYLTTKGTALMQRLRELHEVHERRMLAKVGEEGRVQLLTLLAMIRDTAEPSWLEQDEET